RFRNLLREVKEALGRGAQRPILESDDPHGASLGWQSNAQRLGREVFAAEMQHGIRAQSHKGTGREQPDGEVHGEAEYSWARRSQTAGAENLEAEQSARAVM